MAFRKVEVSIRSICASVTWAHLHGHQHQVWFDTMAAWMGRKLSDQELEDVLLTYKEENRATAREQLLDFRREYLWDSDDEDSLSRMRRKTKP